MVIAHICYVNMHFKFGIEMILQRAHYDVGNAE